MRNFGLSVAVTVGAYTLKTTLLKSDYLSRLKEATYVHCCYKHNALKHYESN